MNWLIDALRNEVPGAGFWPGVVAGVMLSAAVAIKLIQVLRKQ